MVCQFRFPKVLTGDHLEPAARQIPQSPKSREFPVSPGISSEKHQCSAPPGIGDGSRPHPFVPPSCAGCHSHSLTQEPRTQASTAAKKGVITFQAAVLRNACPHAARRVRENSRGLEAPCGFLKRWSRRLALMFRAL